MVLLAVSEDQGTVEPKAGCWKLAELHDIPRRDGHIRRKSGDEVQISHDFTLPGQRLATNVEACARLAAAPPDSASASRTAAFGALFLQKG